jgi:protease I
MPLKQKKIALFVADHYEDLEFWYPYYRMKEEGMGVVVVGPSKDTFRGKNGIPATADIAISEAKPAEFDGLIIPGGYSPDHMRRSAPMVDFVKEIHERAKPVAAICHGPWMLASAGILEGKQVTSFISIKDDLVHAGAEWLDEEVVNDNRVITSRTPEDLPAFCSAIIQALAEM